MSTAKAPARRSPKGSSAAATDASNNYRQRQLDTSRFGIVYDIDGPRVRLGVAWFVACIVALVIGIVPFALLLAGVAALAGAQTAQALKARWRRPDRAAAAAVGALVPLAAVVGTGLAGVALIASAFGVTVHANTVRVKGSDPLVNAGAVVRSALGPGLAAASLVVLYRVDIGAAVTLVLMVSAYEAGDYLVGSGASNPVEGPASGMLAVAVLTGALAVDLISPPPFEGASIWFFGAVALLTAPMGQVVASAILPRAGAPARALRRLDSYLVAGPVWLVLMWAGLHA